MIPRLCLSLILLTILPIGAGARSLPPVLQDSSAQPPRMINPPAQRHPADQDVSLPDEMRSRMMIERAEHEYHKFLEEVDKLNDLAAEVAKAYQERNHLSSEEVKKVGAIEKLAKRVLSHAGGDEVGGPPKSGQMTLANAVAQMNTTAASIKKAITAETRYVVSATVVANSNEVISLAQFIRRNQKTD